MYERYKTILKDEKFYDEMDIVLDLHKRISAVPGGWAGGDVCTTAPQNIQKLGSKPGQKPSQEKVAAAAAAAAAAVKLSAAEQGISRIGIDYLYVDETQDFTQAELLLFWRIMKDPNKSLFAGDTAQAIARGVSFRFADITTMAYALTSGKEAERLVSSPITVVPPVHALVHNYRSHNGILRVAATVVQLIQKYFPLSIDPPGDLPPDQGVSSLGPKPCLVSDIIGDTLVHSL